MPRNLGWGRYGASERGESRYRLGFYIPTRAASGSGYTVRLHEANTGDSGGNHGADNLRVSTIYIFAEQEMR
jgi:hypothetical protein